MPKGGWGFFSDWCLMLTVGVLACLAIWLSCPRPCSADGDHCVTVCQYDELTDTTYCHTVCR